MTMNTSSPEFGHVIALVSAAAGGFFGSGSAFLLEWLRRRREDREKQYQTLFTNQFTLITQHNSLLLIKTRYLDPHRSDPNRSAKLVPTVLHTSELRVAIGDIAFLANEGCADTLNNIHIAESCFLNAVAALNLRNQKIHDFQNDPTVELQAMDRETGRAIVKADPRKIQVINAITNGLYESVDDAEAKYSALIPEVRMVIKRLFPGKKAFQYLPEK
jgi:hypothetical protein